MAGGDQRCPLGGWNRDMSLTPLPAPMRPAPCVQVRFLGETRNWHSACGILLVAPKREAK